MDNDDPKKPRISDFDEPKNKIVALLVDILNAICGWFFRLQEAAARQRHIYRKEANSTVADCIAEDVQVIESANLPMIWILTAPGTPCTALIHRLADTYNLYHLNVGALLQREIGLEMKREAEVQHLMHRGVAIPRAFIFEMVRSQMAQICHRKEHKGFILTEYPSTYSQSNDFFNSICKPDFILYIKFSEKLTQENVFIYLKFQVRASKLLRKIHPDLQGVSSEQTQKFKRDIDRINKKFPDRFKIINAAMSPLDVCREIMKWIERSAVMHNVIPPLFVDPPLEDYYEEP